MLKRKPAIRSFPMSTALAHPSPIRLLKEYGRGPDTVVFVGRREHGDGAELVALKVLRSRGPRELTHLYELIVRQRQLARLRHRHIVAHEGFGRIAGHPALLGPFVEGVDLLELCEVLSETAVAIPARVSCDVLRATASALDVALNRPLTGTSGLKVVHRDLKPQNLMVDRDGELKVLDFACGFTSLAGRKSRSGALQKGLIRYLSPQRRAGKRGTPADDVYALGIFGIELFRGRWLRRIQAHNPAHDRHLAEVVANLSGLRMAAGADERSLRSILLRMVAYDPEARPAAAEIAQTFRRLSDRASGASLTSFAHDHAIPWLEPVGDDPDPKLIDHQFEPISAEEIPALTEIPHPDPSFTETDTPSAPERVWEETEEGWEEQEEDTTDEITLTEGLAELTAAALRAQREEPGGPTQPPQPSPLAAEGPVGERTTGHEPELPETTSEEVAIVPPRGRTRVWIGMIVTGGVFVVAAAALLAWLAFVLAYLATW